MGGHAEKVTASKPYEKREGLVDRQIVLDSGFKSKDRDSFFGSALIPKSIYALRVTNNRPTLLMLGELDLVGAEKTDTRVIKNTMAIFSSEEKTSASHLEDLINKGAAQFNLGVSFRLYDLSKNASPYVLSQIAPINAKGQKEEGRNAIAELMPIQSLLSDILNGEISAANSEISERHRFIDSLTGTLRDLEEATRSRDSTKQ